MEPRREEHDGHTIDLTEQDGDLTLLIDGQPVPYGRLAGGLYFLHDYAYDWADDLLEVGRRFVSYRTKADQIRRDRQRREQANS